MPEAIDPIRAGDLAAFIATPSHGTKKDPDGHWITVNGRHLHVGGAGDKSLKEQAAAHRATKGTAPWRARSLMARTKKHADKAGRKAKAHLAKGDAAKAAPHVHRSEVLSKRLQRLLPHALGETPPAKFAERNGPVMSTAKRRRTAPAVFDLSPGERDGEMIRHRGVTLFEAGSYPQKRFAMSPEEIKAAAEAFAAPVPLELEHINSEGTATFLDGEYGTVENVQAVDDGKRFIGDIVLDPWVDRKWSKFIEKSGQQKRQISAVWDRASKTLQKVGMVIKGHVPAAAFSAAFSDQADDSKLDALFTARKRHDEKTETLQHVHNLVAIHPGVCVVGGYGMNPNDPDRDGDVDTSPAAFSGTTEQFKALKSMHRMAVEHGATCPKMSAKMSDSDPPAGKARKVNMTPQEKLSRALFGDKADAPALSPAITDAQAEAALAALRPKTPDPAALFAASPEAKAMQAKIDALEAANEKARKEARQTEAARFAEDLARTGRIDPVLKADFASLIVDLAEDDHAAPKSVTFSDPAGKEAKGNRVDKVMNMFAKLRSHLHDSPAFDPTVVISDKHKALFNDGDSTSGTATRTDAERKAELLGKTDAGRAALKAQAQRACATPRPPIS